LCASESVMKMEHIHQITFTLLLQIGILHSLHLMFVHTLCSNKHELIQLSANSYQEKSQSLFSVLFIFIILWQNDIIADTKL